MYREKRGGDTVTVTDTLTYKQTGLGNCESVLLMYRERRGRDTVTVTDNLTYRQTGLYL